MALTLERVLGRDVTVTTTGGTVTLWDTISIDLPDADFEATAAASLFKQYVQGQLDQGTMKVSGYIGADDAVRPASGDTISSIDIAVGLDSLLPADIDSAVSRGKWKVRNPSYNFEAGPAKYSFDIKSGYID